MVVDVYSDADKFVALIRNESRQRRALVGNRTVARVLGIEYLSCSKGVRGVQR